MLKDIHCALREKEVEDGFKRYNLVYQSVDPKETQGANHYPLAGHKITKEYRTKMVDWMVEVCSTFKFCQRSYFLSVVLLDKYLVASWQKGEVLDNKDIHPLGVAAMYLGCKYEDVVPLHSKVVSERIAHKAVSAE